MRRPYASNSRRPGELSTTEAAKRLGIHPRTVNNWAKEAISGGGSELEPGEVRRDLFGRYWVDESAVDRIPSRLSIDDYI